MQIHRISGDPLPNACLLIETIQLKPSEVTARNDTDHRSVFDHG